MSVYVCLCICVCVSACVYVCVSREAVPDPRASRRGAGATQMLRASTAEGERDGDDGEEFETVAAFQNPISIPPPLFRIACSLQL